LLTSDKKILNYEHVKRLR